MEPSEFVKSLNAQLTYLFAFTRSINELDFAAALFLESRGMQDAGWNTTQTAFEVHQEMHSLGNKKTPFTRAEIRQLLGLYCQLGEAGGVYEGLANLMAIVCREPYKLWPFQDLVRVKQTPKRVIGPNANAMFRRLAERAATIGMIRLARLLEFAFRDDIRNAIFHADYIIWGDKLRLRKRNGGSPLEVSLTEVVGIVNIGMFLFELFTNFVKEGQSSFRPAKRIVGKLSENPPMAWTVELGDNGA